MPAATHAQERAARVHVQGRQQRHLPDNAVQLVFERLPLGDQVFTVSVLSRAWWRWSQPQQQELQERRQQVQLEEDIDYTVPLWLGQKAWPALTELQCARLFRRAARHGDISALHWMWEQQREQPFSALGDLDWECFMACREAALPSGGHLEALRLLCALQPPCDLSSQVCAAAAQGGHLIALQWMRAQDPPCRWDESECAGAAGCGQLAVLQWLRARDPPCPWNERACMYAAESGQLAVLQWLRAQDPPCPWDESACWEAASSGELAVLRWLRSQDPPCPWDQEECFIAAEGGDVGDWIEQQPGD